MGNILLGAQPRKSTRFIKEQPQARLRRITEVFVPKYSQLLVRAKRLQDVLPRYPDLQSLITQTFCEVRELQGLVDKDQKALLAKVRVIRTDLHTYEDNLLEVLEKLEAYTAEGVGQTALLGNARGCQELWKKTELQCRVLFPDVQLLDLQYCVSALTDTKTYLSTLLETVPEKARRPCLLEERVQLVSDQAERLCEQLGSPDTSGDLLSCQVRFLRVFQRLLFLWSVCSLIAK